MIAVIQCVLERQWYAERTISEFTKITGHMYVDRNRVGPFQGFINTLKRFPSGDEYRLHLQDDVILTRNLEDYLPSLEDEMRSRSIDVLSLYAPRRGHIDTSAELGERIAKFPNFLTMVSVLFSPWAVEAMLRHAGEYDGFDDDTYVQKVLRKNRRKAYLHLPSLAQHNVALKSSMGHAATQARTSKYFDPDFVSKWKAGTA